MNTNRESKFTILNGEYIFKSVDFWNWGEKVNDIMDLYAIMEEKGSVKISGKFFIYLTQFFITYTYILLQKYKKNK